MEIDASTKIKELFAAQNPALLDNLQSLATYLKIYFEKLPHLPVNPKPDAAQVESLLNFSFDHPIPLLDILNQWTNTLGETLLHVDHPMYFGVFNPNPLFASVLADVLIAQFNPNLASTASGRIGIALENKIISYFGEKAGWNKNDCDGTFCSGGTEANLNAILFALARHCPIFFTEGARFLKKNPLVYASSEAHHSIQKSLKILGLGFTSLREIPVDLNLQFDTKKLIKQIEIDRSQGNQGILIVGTIGSTSAGTIDPLQELGRIAKLNDMDFHIDAAFGAGALLLPEFKAQLHGVETADSITIDAHKWFSVPMTAGIFINRHPGVLRSIFDIDNSHYMPPESLTNQETEPFRDSLQWSRRLSGLKLLFNFMAIGESGYQTLFRHSIMLADYFRSKLKTNSDWQIDNISSLPVVCFHLKALKDKQDIETFAFNFNKTGKAWITSTIIRNQTVLRVGFPNFATTKQDVDLLWELLKQQAAISPRSGA